MGRGGGGSFAMSKMQKEHWKEQGEIAHLTFLLQRFKLF
jgi:hypothetical protein